MKFRASAICDLLGVSRRQLDRWIKGATQRVTGGKVRRLRRSCLRRVQLSRGLNNGERETRL